MFVGPAQSVLHIARRGPGDAASGRPLGLWPCMHADEGTSRCWARQWRFGLAHGKDWLAREEKNPVILFFLVGSAPAACIPLWIYNPSIFGAITFIKMATRLSPTRKQERIESRVDQTYLPRPNSLSHTHWREGGKEERWVTGRRRRTRRSAGEREASRATEKDGAAAGEREAGVRWGDGEQ